MYSHILLAVDLSKHCELVADKARELATLYKCKLSLLHVIEPIPTYGYIEIAELEEARREEVNQALVQLGQRLQIPALDQHIEVGLTKHQVLKKAKELNVDLLVVGSHHHHGLAILLGSTANAILHNAECDVMVVRLKDV
jgi:universal stress protein A